MKPGEFRKVYVEYYGGVKAEYIGIILDVSESETPVITFLNAKNGTVLNINSKVIQKCVFARQLPAEARDILYQYFKAYKLKAKEMQRHKKEMNDIEKKLSAFTKERIVNSMNILTYSQFIEVFLKNLPIDVRRQLKENKYQFDFYDDYLEIERREYIKKWFRHGSFVFEEYDGTIQFIDKAEDDPEYKRFIKTFSRPLPVKHKCTSYLSLGDKNWLICCDRYTIKLKETLTEEYAVKLAKEF